MFARRMDIPAVLASLMALTGACRFDPVARAGSGSCGNGKIDPGEECDGDDLQGRTCESLGFMGGGMLACGSDCRLETGACSSGSCGDGIIDRGEDCDGTNVGSVTCELLGFGGGTVGCTQDCRFDTSRCGSGLCGNGVQEAAEDCDGTDLGGKTCSDLGLGAGTLLCGDDCEFDVRGCQGGRCGDGIAQPVLGESCDGMDMGGHDCSDLGLSGGPALCSSDCRVDYGPCTKRDLGSACERAGQCVSGLCIEESSFGVPRGVCSRNCGADHRGGCPAGFVCTKLGQDLWFCLEQCSSGDCDRPGFSCFGPLDSGLLGSVCYPFCRRDDQCASGDCNEWTGRCSMPVSGNDVGGPCSTEDDCKGRLCVQDVAGGYCTAPCDMTAGCPAGEICVDWFDGSAADFGFCMQTCSRDETCRQQNGFYCGSAHGTDGVCVW